VEPIPETVRAIEELPPSTDGGRLLAELVEKGRRISALVPDCIALALVSSEHAVTFALLSSRRQLGLLAALQSEAEAAGTDDLDEEAGTRPSSVAADLLDEGEWHRRALSDAAPCVASSLTLPVRGPATLAGSVTLYGASRRAFDGHRQHLAEILDAWAPGAVTNADLPFRALVDAQEAPARLRRAGTLEEATRIVSLIQGLAPEAARQRIRDAATRAGISEEQLAEAVIRLRRP
jgi:hypothetical protein